MNDFDAAVSGQGCVPLVVATVFAALLLTLAIMPPFWGFGLFGIILIVTTFVVVSLGLPLYTLVIRWRGASYASATIVGAITGAAIPLLIAFSDQSEGGLLTAFAFALVGAVSGLAFFLIATAPQNRARNIAILIVLAALSIAATPLLAALL